MEYVPYIVVHPLSGDVDWNQSNHSYHNKTCNLPRSRAACCIPLLLQYSFLQLALISPAASHVDFERPDPIRRSTDDQFVERSIDGHHARSLDILQHRNIELLQGHIIRNRNNSNASAPHVGNQNSPSTTTTASDHVPAPPGNVPIRIVQCRKRPPVFVQTDLARRATPLFLVQQANAPGYDVHSADRPVFRVEQQIPVWRAGQSANTV